MAAVEVDSERALSQRLGHGPTMITSKRQRGNMPLKEAVAVALETGESLDWLILGRRPDGLVDRAVDTGMPAFVAEAGESEQRPARINPALYPERADRPDPDLSFRETRPEAYSQPDAAVPPPADHDRWLRLLRDVFEGVESALSELDVQLPPAKKADLVMALCELYADASAQPSRHHILQLVRSAS